MFLKKYKNLLEFKPYFKKYKGLIIALMFVMVIASSMGMLVAYLMSEQLIAITNQILNTIVKFTVLILIVILIHHINWYLWEKISNILGNKIAFNIKSDIINKTLNTNYLTVKDKPLGYYLERLNDDVSEVSFFVQNVAGTMADVLTNTSFLIIIYFLSWQSGLFFTIGIVVLFLIDLIKLKIDLKNLKNVKNSLEDSNTKFAELIRGVKDIKGLGIKNQTKNINLKTNKTLSAFKIKQTKDYAFWSRIRTYFEYIIDAGLVFMCAFWLFPTGKVEVVVFLLIFNYKNLMYDTISFFSQIKNFYLQGNYKAGRILEIINNNDLELFGSKDIKISNASITVENLSFKYGEKEVLSNVSFNIHEKSATALIGVSGSGKSTLFGIMSKLLSVENNKVFINKFDINDFTEKSLKEAICVINQEPFIFNDTIENNIKIVKPNASLNEITEVCKLVNIHSEILEMKNGYKTFLNENGANLSGGQKQRIAIARALLKNSLIILFDEPTSALDSENQVIFFNLINELKKTKTIFIIAHKLSSYENFDQVLSLKKGKLEIVNK